MNLKIKATLLWLLAIGLTILATAIIFAAATITLLHPAMVLITCMVSFMIYVLISAWVSIYKYLKSKEEPTMTTFIILAKRHTQTFQLSYLAENMRAAIDEFRLTYPKKHYTIIDCKVVTNYNR